MILILLHRFNRTASAGYYAVAALLLPFFLVALIADAVQLVYWEFQRPKLFNARALRCTSLQHWIPLGRGAACEHCGHRDPGAHPLAECPKCGGLSHLRCPSCGLASTNPLRGFWPR